MLLEVAVWQISASHDECRGGKMEAEGHQEAEAPRPVLVLAGRRHEAEEDGLYASRTPSSDRSAPGSTWLPRGSSNLHTKQRCVSNAARVGRGHAHEKEYEDGEFESGHTHPGAPDFPSSTSSTSSYEGRPNCTPVLPRQRKQTMQGHQQKAGREYSRTRKRGTPAHSDQLHHPAFRIGRRLAHR